jgi:Domain of unknown function (DUF1918)
MHAKAGDRIIIKGHRRGEPDRDGEIVEVRGIDGGPPYLVRWDDSDHAALLFRAPTPSSRSSIPRSSPARRGGNAHH